MFQGSPVIPGVWDWYKDVAGSIQYKSHERDWKVKLHAI